MSFSGSSAEARARFLASFDRTGSVTVSATELGPNRNTCDAWGRAAGLRSNRHRPGHPRRAAYDQLRGAGASRRAAAPAVGVNVRTAHDWDRGIRKINNSRLRPDGRRIYDTRGVTTQQPGPPPLGAELHPRFLFPG